MKPISQFAQTFDVFVVGGVHLTDRYVRLRQREPGLFEEGSFRTIRLTSGIKAIVGRLKGEKTTTIQSIIFDKKKFSAEEAQKWVAKHKEKFSFALKVENLKHELFIEEVKMEEKKVEPKNTENTPKPEEKKVEEKPVEPININTIEQELTEINKILEERKNKNR